MSEEPTLSGLRVDMNGDGLLSVADLPPWLVEAFFLPGDWLIAAALTYASPVARLLQLDPGDYGGVLSGVVSAMAWFLGARIASSMYGTTRDIDHALTQTLIQKNLAARRGVRISFARLKRSVNELPRDS